MKSVTKMANPGVLRIHPYSPGKPIEELEREYGIKNSIKLASNENPLGPGAAARAAIYRNVQKIAFYPDSHGYYLKKRLADHLQVSPEHITLGNGSNEILELVARAFVAPGEQVIYSQHAFVVYPIVTQAVGAEAVVTPAHQWGTNLPAMQAAIGPKTKLIFIANPNNPTGTWSARKELREFLQAVPANILVVLDEAYAEYVLEEDYPQCIAWLDEFPNLIVTRTFSKIYGLAGIRVGYGVCHPDIAGLLNRVRAPFNVSNLGLAAAEAAIDDHNHVVRSRELNQRGLQQLSAGINKLGLTSIPSVGNFITLDLGCSAIPVYEALLQLGVITRHIGNYAMPNHLRVTVGLAGENRRFLSSLEKVLGARVDG